MRAAAEARRRTPPPAARRTGARPPARRIARLAQGDRIDRDGPAAARGEALDDRAGEGEAREAVGAGGVEDAGVRVPPSVAAHAAGYGQDRLGEVRRIGRAAELVLDDAQAILLGGQADHRAHEIAAMGPIEPGGAQDHVARIGRRRRSLAGQLRAAVDVERRRRVGLVIGRALGPVEDVVGGDLDHGDAEPGGAGGGGGRAVAVDGEGQVRLALCLVHGGVGRGVDHDVGLERLHRRRERLRPQQVDQGPRAVPDHDAGGRRGLAQGPRELTPRAGDEDPHGQTNPPPAARPRSGSHQSRRSKYQAIVCSSPLSKLSWGHQPSIRSSLPGSIA